MNFSNHWKLDRDHLWHPYTRFSALDHGPLPCIERAEGVYLYTTDGRCYMDAIASWWSCALGHGHPAIVEAICRQAPKLQHSILGNLSHPCAIELAALIAQFFPDARRHVLFASDGASAVEAALKIAAQYAHNTGKPQRSRFAALRHAYHGDTLGAVSVGYIEGFHAPFRPLLNPAIMLPVPGSAAEEPTCREEAERLFAQHSDSLAALIVEPLCLCAAGMKMYPASYLAFLARLCRQHGVLLISDEIATGFGRTGRWFAFEHAGLDPDIVCLGKALSAGALPISATVVKDFIYETFADRPTDRTFYHGHTFCGNPVAAAAALAALNVYRQINMPERAMWLAQTFQTALAPLAQLKGIADVRVLGGIAAVELLHPSNIAMAAGEEAVPPAQRIRQWLFDHGVLIRPLGNVVYLFPPLTISEEDLSRLLSLFTQAVAAVAE